MFKERTWKQCRHVKFKGNMTKMPVQKQTHRAAHKHVDTKKQQTFRKKTILFVFFGYYTIQYIYSCEVSPDKHYFKDILGQMILNTPS